MGHLFLSRQTSLNVSARENALFSARNVAGKVSARERSVISAREGEM